VEKKKFINYRNSQLTRLLMSSLDGNSKTLMFVNVSLLQDHHTETIKSLKFAADVEKVEVGKAKKNKQPAKGMNFVLIYWSFEQDY
jgi:kinesin family member C1